jgi:hypothetical protein
MASAFLNLYKVRTVAHEIYIEFVMLGSFLVWGLILFGLPFGIMYLKAKRNPSKNTIGIYDKICCVCLHSCSGVERFSDENGNYFHKECASAAYTHGRTPRGLLHHFLGECPYSFEVQRNITRINFQHYFRDLVPTLEFEDLRGLSRRDEREAKIRDRRSWENFKLKLFKKFYAQERIVPFAILDEVIEEYFSDETQSIEPFLPKGSKLSQSHFEFSKEESLFMRFGPLVHVLLWLGLSAGTFFYILSKGSQ